uniref:Uncharacterized protein n=1 Tax=Stegastes partitus TaxID=144197 RepID=A0A3B5ALW4_9TELE
MVSLNAKHANANIENVNIDNAGQAVANNANVNCLLCPQESLTGSPSPCPSPSDDELHPQEPTSQSPSRASSSSSSSPPPPTHTPELGQITYTAANVTLTLNPAPAFAPFLLAEGLSSMETLLTNIQGLLKVAVESVRSQDKQNQLERKELKLELERERDARQALQRHLSSELQSRVSIQRRLKKEKKAKRKLQEMLDFESRRRQQVERALKQTDCCSGEHIKESSYQLQR